MPEPHAESPLSPEHLREVARARAGGRKARRGATVATFSAWSIAVFAVLSVLLALLLADWPSVVAGFVMGAIAAVEFRGASLIRRLEPRGARLLGFNQLAFGGGLVLYAAWKLVDSLRTGPSPELAQLGPDVDSLYRTLTLAVWLGVALVGVLGPGLTALYYFTRARVVCRFVESTPPWIVEVLRAGA